MPTVLLYCCSLMFMRLVLVLPMKQLVINHVSIKEVSPPKLLGTKVKLQQGQKWTSKATVLCLSPLTLQSYHWMAAMQSKGHNDWTARGQPNLLCTYTQHGCLEDVQTPGGGSFKHRNLRKIQPCELPRLYSSDTDSFEQINDKQ